MDRHLAKRVLTSALLLQVPMLAKAETSIFNSFEKVSVLATQNKFEGAVRINDISRKNGGDLYALDLAKPLPLTFIKAKPKSGKVKIISVNLITDKSERIIVKAFNGVTISDNDKELSSENLNSASLISAIEIQAEAMGGSAVLDFNAISTQEAPKLALRESGNSPVPPGNDNGSSCNKKFDAVLKEKLDIVQLWASRAEGSTQGSWQEKYATKEFNKFVADFIVTLKADKTTFASTDYTLTLLNFFAERHNSSRADGALEQGYKLMADETFDVFMLSLQSDQICRPVTSESLIKIALDFQKRQEANKPDSRARKLYESMIAKIGKLIPTHYRRELTAKNLSFRAADSEGYKNHKLFVTSKAESFLKGTYQEMSLSAYGIAEQALLREVKDLNNEQTYQLIVEFQTKYNDTANYPQEVMLKYLTILSEHSNFLKLNQRM
ncbi:beta-sandwich domain-containing protein [Bdellovibrio sp. KM01]|uniref:beta-sandwich domain-containing protein n=1 Tax=Bdellovibrio sp. KM01 TaxID=2748865 RepID=UPI0015E9A03A|nr:beta-sandwich domain-containing protein [Bdellovibrio sp. KM01]QLY26707.1 beta-sandwich domain-containing protein [Bdellovibrio sp. KM01]